MREGGAHKDREPSNGREEDKNNDERREKKPEKLEIAGLRHMDSVEEILRRNSTHREQEAVGRDYGSPTAISFMRTWAFHP